MRILCVEDDKVFLVLYDRVLHKCCLPDDQIVLTGSGEEAIARIDAGPFDIVMTDLMLPGVSGLEVLKHAKAVNPAVEVIVITGQGSIDSAVEVMKLGARDYLAKPVNTGLLAEKLANIRELILRSHEVEDYRLAKETIEENAFKSVAEMEIKLDGYIRLTDAIRAAILSDKSPDDRFAEVLKLIDTHERNTAA